MILPLSNKSEDDILFQNQFLRKKIPLYIQEEKNVKIMQVQRKKIKKSFNFFVFLLTENEKKYILRLTYWSDTKAVVLGRS